LFIAKGKGAIITDVEGKDYIDFAGGLGALNTGHAPEPVRKAMDEQAGKYLHTGFTLVYYEPYLTLAEKINSLAPGDTPKKTFFLNSGAEAVENAVKIARFYTKRPAIVCFDRAFHGRTLLTMTMTSRVTPWKKGFGPYMSAVHRAPYAYCYRCMFGKEYPSCDLYCANYLEEFFLSRVAAEEVAAVIMEPVLGEGGYVVPPKGYIERVKEICESKGILLVIDEVQAGMGRTGKMFAIENFDVEPDLMTVGKSIGGGLPLSGVCGKAEIMDALPAGTVGGTMCGNPAACAAAMAVFDMFEEQKLLEASNRIGKTLTEWGQEMMQKHELIGDVRGLGAMVGIELVEDRKTKEPAGAKTRELFLKAFEKGLLLLPCGLQGNVIRIVAPLVIAQDQLEAGCKIMDEVLTEIGKA
jgi:4-aminobutyrate aminotransferase/(S)-3-amino-2-methylpropionate transaminase